MSAEQINFSTEDDKGYKAKRTMLFSLSLLLLALVATGAQVKEVNTLIFKIELTRHENLQWLLVAGVLYSVLRYYTYSEQYRVLLQQQWTRKLITDWRVFNFDPHLMEIAGLLGGAVDIDPNEHQGITQPSYVKIGIFKRALTYRVQEIDDQLGPCSYRKAISLNEYTDNWSRKHFRKLLGYEFKYRWEAWVSHRETLDLMAPYLLAAVALLAFLYTKLVA